MEDTELRRKLDALEKKIDDVYVSAEKTRKYFLGVIIVSVVAFVLILLLFSLGLLEIFVTDPDSRKIVQYLSLLEHFRNFSKGVLDTRPVVFYVSVTAGALFLTTRTIASPRWRA